MNSIVENNKLMAQFLWTFENGDPFKTCDFESDWNWLMLVVEKIEGIGVGGHNYTVTIKYDICSIDWSNYGLRGDTPIIFKRSIDQRNKIDAVYKACVEFIKWYNTNKK